MIEMLHRAQAGVLARLEPMTSHLRPTSLVTALLALCTVLTVLPGPASAGTYTVHSCRTPDGGFAPTSGWVVTAYAPSISSWASACPRGGFSLALDPRTTHPKEDTLEAVWTAPRDTLVVGYSYWRSVEVGAGTHYFFAQTERRLGVSDRIAPDCRGDRCSGLGTAADPLSPRNRWDRRPPQPVNAIGLYLSCGYFTASDPDCPPADPAIRVTLHRADITLSDDVAPTWLAEPAGGLLTTTAPQSGVQQVAFQGADRGGGVADVAIEINGQVVSRGVFNDQDRTCAPPYTAPVPCPLNVGGQLAFDTAALPDGDHTLRMLITDAAGNVTPWGPIKITTRNARPDPSCQPDPALSGPASLQALSKRVPRKNRPTKARTRMIVPYGRAMQVTGVLRGAGRVPVPGAPICLVSRHDGSRGPFVPIGRATTGSDGRYTARLPNGPSREIRAVYRLGNGAIVGRTLLRVRPSVTANPQRRKLRNGQVLVIKGRVRGGPIPRRGVALNVQSIREGRWQGFSDPIRTDSKGRFRFRYRFTRTLGVQRYRLRVRVFAQTGYPYLTGFSKRISIRVTGS